MFVSEKDIETYVDMVLALPMFQQHSKKAELRQFLIDIFRELYQDNVQDIERIFNNTFSLNPVSYVFALSLGILNEDIVKAIRYFLKDTIQLLINKASVNDVIYLKQLMVPFGVDIKLYNVIVKNHDHYVAKEIETGEQVIFDENQEFISDIHLIRLDEYKEKIQEESFTTIILFLKISNVVVFDHETTAPPSAMITYAFTRYKDELIHFTLGTGSTFSSTMIGFMKIFRYIYLRYIQAKNPGFDTTQFYTGETFWYLLRDDTQLSELYDLVDMYMHEIKNRTDADNYIRMEALFLNENTITLNNDSISDIRDYLYIQYPTIISYIDQHLTSVEDLYLFLNNMRSSLILKTHSMTYANDVDRASFLVFLYLVNTIVFDVEKISREANDILYTFKKYFLPIYTTFHTKIEYVQSIKNRLNKLYTDYRISNTVVKPFMSLVELWDDQNGQVQIKQDDIVLSVDSGEAIVTPRWYEDLELQDIQKLFFSGTKGNSLLDINDDQNVELPENIQEQLNQTDNIYNSIVAPDLNDTLQISNVIDYEQQQQLTDDVSINDHNIAKRVFILPTETERDNISDHWVFTIYNEDNTVKEVVSSS